MDSRKKPPSEGVPDKAQSQGSKLAGDATNEATSTTDVDEKCVLFGRGKGCNNHPGNKRMRTVIDRYRDEYQAAERGDKKLTVLKVHEELVDEGMRFLKQEEGIKGWVEADADEAIKKVGHAIRCNRNNKDKSGRADNDHQPRAAAQAASVPIAAGLQASPVPGQMLQDNFFGVAGGDVAASLALASARTAASAGFPSADALQQLLGGSTTLTAGSNPVLSPQSIPMQLNNGLPPSLSASMGRLAQPSPPSSLTQNHGLSAVEIYVLMERERQLQQAMLYDQILRNAKK